MAYKVKGSISSVDAILLGGVVFDNEKIQNSQEIPLGKFTINQLDDSSTTDLAQNTLVTNFGKNDEAGMFSFNTGDWKDTDSAPVKLMMRVVNDVNDSDWVTIFDSSKTTVTWSSIAFAGQTQFTVPNLDFKKAIIYVNGVLQYPGLSYQTFGGTVTFSDKLSLGDQIYIIVGEDTESTKNSEFISTATSGQTVITLETEKTNNFVYINGVLQYPTSYSITGSTITLSSELYLNDNILVLSNDTAMNTFSASSVQDQKDFTLTDTFDSGMVFVNGILQYDNSYSITGNTLSFITELNLNDEVFVFLNDPKFIDSVNTTYTSTVDDVQNSDKINIPYFHFSELQVFINGILQNPDSGAYTLNGTEITLSSPLQVLDDIHVIVYNSPVQSDNLVTRADLASYASADELQALKTALLNEGINLKWQPHLPTIEVAFGLPRRSLKIWESGSTSNTNNYWLYPVDGTVWAGVGTLGTVPSSPFYKLDSNKDVITWTYTAVSDNVSRIFVPYNFGSITIFINGVLQSIELGHYTYSGQYITLNGSLNTGDNLIAILGKLIFNTNPYVTYEYIDNMYYSKKTLNSSSGSSLIGYNNSVVSAELDDINLVLTKIMKSDGFKYIGSFESISELFSIAPNKEGEIINVKSYYPGSYIGGGFFISVLSSVYKSDNYGVCFESLSPTYNWYRLETLYTNTYYLEDFGCDSSNSDNSENLKKAFTWPTTNKNGIYTIKSKNNIFKTSKSIGIVDFGYTNINFDKNVTISCLEDGSLYTVFEFIMTARNTTENAYQGRYEVCKNLNVYAPNKDTSNITAYYIHDMWSAKIGIGYHGVNTGISWGSNVWTIEIVGKGSAARCWTNELAKSNAGENISIGEGSNFFNSRQHFDMSHHQFLIHAFGTSFDYSPAQLNNPTFDLGNSTLDLYGCHIEYSGPTYAPLVKITGDFGKFNMDGGTLMLVVDSSIHYKYMFETKCDNQISVNRTNVFGTRMITDSLSEKRIKYNPSLNNGSTQNIGKLVGNGGNSLADPLFTKQTFLDKWYIEGGNKTTRYASNYASIEISSYATSTSGYALKINKLISGVGNNVSVRLEIPNNKTYLSPHVSFKFVSDNDNNASLSLTVNPCNIITRDSTYFLPSSRVRLTETDRFTTISNFTNGVYKTLTIGSIESTEILNENADVFIFDLNITSLPIGTYYLYDLNISQGGKI